MPCRSPSVPKEQIRVDVSRGGRASQYYRQAGGLPSLVVILFFYCGMLPGMGFAIFLFYIPV
jgi:hypothetical protein